jgi:hypothetical protein
VVLVRYLFGTCSCHRCGRLYSGRIDIEAPACLHLLRYAAAATRRSSTKSEFSGSLDAQASVLAALRHSFAAPAYLPHPGRHDVHVRTDRPLVHGVHVTGLVCRRLLCLSCNGAGNAYWCPARVTGMDSDRVALHGAYRLGHLLVDSTPPARRATLFLRSRGAASPRALVLALVALLDRRLLVFSAADSPSR